MATGSGVMSIMSDGVYVASPVVGRVVRPVARLYSPAHDLLSHGSSGGPMNAEFNWWLLIVGLVIGAALTWLVMADLTRRDVDVDAAEQASEARWIATIMTDTGQPVAPDRATTWRLRRPTTRSSCRTVKTIPITCRRSHRVLPSARRPRSPANPGLSCSAPAPCGGRRLRARVAGP